jgi:hypothetical protein
LVSDIKGRTNTVVYANSALRRIFEPKRGDTMKGSIKVHNEELHTLYSSPKIIRMIKSRRMKFAGHIACMGK